MHTIHIHQYCIKVNEQCDWYIVCCSTYMSLHMYVVCLMVIVCVCVFRTMIHRLNNIPMDENDYKDELNTIKYLAESNGYDRTCLLYTSRCV